MNKRGHLGRGLESDRSYFRDTRLTIPRAMIVASVYDFDSHEQRYSSSLDSSAR
jgi:hypothetical protein